eukprot:NODE_1506_length_832_cov_98.148936_g1458_i0.p1 GENE.NODE_1506_length_832_cov_98.148936_g1458_i0~~NODE_1506_length_832_cov_98.148936_g1458_i0.p1  ORF type:complete len:204 (+),score=42.83 NODE_1506_length_832_cov_98.148936_g1458_i0:94-705(+)
MGENTTQAVDLTGNTEGKHKLQNAWEIWYDSRKLQMQNPDNWFANLQAVALFNTVEDFWRTYNHIKHPTDIEHGANYHFFKKGIKPMWEDPANEAGGKWTTTLNPKDTRLDEYWELLLLAMIGEYLDPEGQDMICGAVLSRRKAGPRISVWTKQADDEEGLKALGSRIKELLDMTTSTWEFQPHKSALETGRSYHQNQATLKV